VNESPSAARKMSRLRHSRRVRRSRPVSHSRRVSQSPRASESRRISPVHRVSYNPRVSRHVSYHRRRDYYYEHFTTSSYADNVTDGDITAGEDPVVRQAAIDALGNMNGTVVAIDPTSGRILAMVNQKLALSEGATPCSTIKLAVALAALSENVVQKETEVRLGRLRLNLTKA